MSIDKASEAEESDDDDAESESSNFEFCVSARTAAAAKSLESNGTVYLGSLASVDVGSSLKLSRRPFSFLQNNSCCF